MADAVIRFQPSTCAAQSRNDRVAIEWARLDSKDMWKGIHFDSPPASHPSIVKPPSFKLEASTTAGHVVAPYWFVVLLTAAMAVAVRPSPRGQFTTRRLLAAVTLAAVVFGVILGTMPRG